MFTPCRNFNFVLRDPVPTLKEEAGRGSVGFASATWLSFPPQFVGTDVEKRKKKKRFMFTTAAGKR